MENTFGCLLRVAQDSPKRGHDSGSLGSQACDSTESEPQATVFTVDGGGAGKKWRMCPLHLSLTETALLDGDQALCSMTERVEDVLLYVACTVPFVRCALESRIFGFVTSRPCRKDIRLATSRYPEAKRMNAVEDASMPVALAAQWAMHALQSQHLCSNSLCC